MARGAPLDARFAAALRTLARFDVSHAEARRRLRPVAAQIGRPVPSYPTVQRFLTAERRRLARRQDELDRVIAEILAGLVPVHRLLER